MERAAMEEVRIRSRKRRKKIRRDINRKTFSSSEE
jgi:hypothetical protein